MIRRLPLKYSGVSAQKVGIVKRSRHNQCWLYLVALNSIEKAK